MTNQRSNHKIPRRTFLKVCAAAAAAGLTACGKTQAAAALPELTVGSDSYPPFVYLSNDSTPTGIDVDIATEAFARMGYAVQMIRNGECGAFNPLLLQCLTDTQDELNEKLHPQMQEKQEKE